MAQATPFQAGLELEAGYRLREIIGKSKTSEVWAASTASGDIVALRIIPIAENYTAAKLVQSLDSIRALKHNHILEIKDIWHRPGYVIIAMEMAEGNLDNLLKVSLKEHRKPLDAKQVCAYMRQAAAALDFLNTAQHNVEGRFVGFQHCFVKPSNLYIQREAIKLSDFEYAVQSNARVQLHLQANTLDFAAPEIFEGKLSDFADQYSLAVTYCLLRGGKLPFPAIQQLRQSWPLRRPAPDLSKLGPGEQSIILRGLQRLPQSRWNSCTEMVTLLSKAI